MLLLKFQSEVLHQEIVYTIESLIQIKYQTSNSKKLQLLLYLMKKKYKAISLSPPDLLQSLNLIRRAFLMLTGLIG